MTEKSALRCLWLLKLPWNVLVVMEFVVRSWICLGQLTFHLAEHFCQRSEEPQFDQQLKEN